VEREGGKLFMGPHLEKGSIKCIVRGLDDGAQHNILYLPPPRTRIAPSVAAVRSVSPPDPYLRKRVTIAKKSDDGWLDSWKVR
jgi:hypothetical protein